MSDFMTLDDLNPNDIAQPKEDKSVMTLSDLKPEDVDKFKMDRRKSAYEGIPNDQLSFIQRVDKFVSQPGYEMAAPGVWGQKLKNAAPELAILGGIGAAAAGAVPAIATAGSAALKYGGRGALFHAGSKLAGKYMKGLME